MVYIGIGLVSLVVGAVSQIVFVFASLNASQVRHRNLDLHCIGPMIFHVLWRAFISSKLLRGQPITFHWAPVLEHSPLEPVT